MSGRRKEHGIWIQEDVGLSPVSAIYELWDLGKTTCPLPLSCGVTILRMETGMTTPRKLVGTK